ncbi:MAG: hypothetical protein FWD53_08580 [Phycisphaerales bacterium]|nr:hypothetical protein [Phycisphaerales bacterium]
MLDDQANKMVEEVLRRVEELLNFLPLTTEEKLYASKMSDKINNIVTEEYLDDRMLHKQEVRPIAVAAAVALSLVYFDKWVVEIERQFPQLGDKSIQ